MTQMTYYIQFGSYLFCLTHDPETGSMTQTIDFQLFGSYIVDISEATRTSYSLVQTNLMTQTTHKPLFGSYMKVHPGKLELREGTHHIISANSLTHATMSYGERQMTEQIERITKYENIFREAKHLIGEFSSGCTEGCTEGYIEGNTEGYGSNHGASSATLSTLISELEAYYTSDVWKQDFADDEAGQVTYTAIRL